MFRLLSRPAHRRPARSTPRTRLQLQSLERRDTPAAPVLSNVSATVNANAQVVITGHVHEDATGPVVVQVSGSALAVALVQPAGGDADFSITLPNASGGAFTVRAEDTTGVYSYDANVQYGTMAAPANAPQLNNVTVTDEGGVWHIRGNVSGGGMGTIINIIGGVQTQGTANDDGSFDIGIELPANTWGGIISITAQNPDGTVSDAVDDIIS